MANRDIVIFGAGQLAEVAHYYFTNNAGRKVCAFTVDAEFLSEDSLLGLPVVDFQSISKNFPTDKYEIYVAIGYKKINTFRSQKVSEVEKLGYRLASFVHSKANVWSGISIKPNTFILEQNIIQPFVSIGKNVTLWSGNHIGHHTSISDHCFISSHVVVAGGVEIGEGSFLGVNSTVRDNVKLGKHVVLGAGSLLLTNAPDYSVYIGPATALSRVPSNRLRDI